ncbi:MAG: GNAT family N-acetyltransferase [Bacteroidales bacterium]|nr:GNAT family N-acetyltransferase [Candidatus Colicola caccequi]
MFNRNYMDYHKDRFLDSSLMFYKDDCELVAILPASIHGTELRSHGGLTYGGIICGESMKQHIMNECFDALLVYAKENSISSIVYKVIPYILTKYPCEEELYTLWRHGAQLIRRDVSSTIDLTCPFKMPKGRKAQIARAKREGVAIEIEENFDEFIALENQVLSTYHQVKAVHTGAELALLNSRFPENIKLYTARKDGELLAGTLIFIYDNAIHTQYMASSELGREIGALDLTIATIMHDYQTTKRYLDFGISTEQEGLVFNDGLAAQKEGFGGRTIVYDIYRL